MSKNSLLVSGEGVRTENGAFILVRDRFTMMNASPSCTLRFISFVTMPLVTRTTTPLGYSISHKALVDAFLAEYTEGLPDILTGMKLPQAVGKDSSFSLDL